MNRAISGIVEYQQGIDEEFSLGDAIAQLDICRKGITLSELSLRELTAIEKSEVQKLIALLANIASRIDLLEKSIR
jgi:hypothetical protein